MTNLFFFFFLQVVINLRAFEFFACTVKNDYEKIEFLFIILILATRVRM